MRLITYSATWLLAEQWQACGSSSAWKIIQKPGALRIWCTERIAASMEERSDGYPLVWLSPRSSIALLKQLQLPSVPFLGICFIVDCLLPLFVETGIRSLA
jgi:hypothetical protein